MTPADRRRAGLLDQLVVLWKLRWTLALGSLPKGAGALAPVAGTMALFASAAATFVAARALLASPQIAQSPRLTLFFLLLVGLLASTMWIAWPVVTAGVDDAAELSRFSLFPISSGRLFFASVTSALVEPRTLPFWGALFGAGSGLGAYHPAPRLLLVFATLCLAALSVVWGRVGLHLVLNLLRHRRSAEAMGLGLLAMLALCALVPPPDLSWLKEVAHGVAAVNDALVRGGIVFFSLLPTGAWALMLFSSAAHAPVAGVLAFAYLWLALAGGYLVALKLLERFHRKAGRALPQTVSADGSRRRFGDGSLLRVLGERELRDLLANPRVRLMLALPFFLAILLKLVGARALAQILAGAQADAWVAGALASYAALVLGAGLSQNLFGYDGPGAATWLASPVEPRTILLAKNLVVGGLSLALVALVVVFETLYVGRPPRWVLLVIAPNATYQVLVSLAAGNVLSIVAPRRFHASLRRRDRASPVATAVGFAVAALAVLPGTSMLRLFAKEPLPATVIVAAWLLPVLAFLAWRASLDLAARLLELRRSELLRVLTRA